MKVSLALKIAAMTLLTVLIGLSGWVINILDAPSWSVLRRLSNDLNGARSVTLKEYAWDTTLVQKKVGRSDIDRLRQITGKFAHPFYSKGSLCFQPHHNIDIVRGDGSEITISICFLCRNILYRDGNKAYPHDLPPYVEQPLTAFFASVGMEPKTEQEYYAYKPPLQK